MTTALRTVNIAISGMGAVGRALADVFERRASVLRDEQGLEIAVTAVVDSGGAAIAECGVDLREIVTLKREGRSVCESSFGVPGGTVSTALTQLQGSIDILVEAGPGNLRDGGAGLVGVRDALSREIQVVLANKAPLAVAWNELRSEENRSRVRFSACVGGALPTISLGRSILHGAQALRIETVLNGTSHLVLRLMERGLDMASAIAQAQAQGIAEPDPSFDIDGIDSAVKLLILSNELLGTRFRLDDVAYRGIGEITRQDLAAARERGEVIVLLGSAQQAPSTGVWQLKVQPTALGTDHPLARMDAEEMGFVLHTDVAGRLAATSLEPDAGPTASAILRDIVELCQ